MEIDLMSYKLVDGKWQGLVDIEVSIDGKKEIWKPIPLVVVPVETLLVEWEDLVHELSEKEMELLKLKEYLNEQSFKIEQETDFKALYGKNNADVRRQHIKGELGDVFDRVQELELGINWIKGYIPLLKEVIRVKQS